MDFAFSSQEEAFRMELRSWLEANLPEGWMDGKRKMPEEKQEFLKFFRQWQGTLYEGGWAAIAWPEEYGGRAASLVEEIIYQQEMVRVQAPPMINYVGVAMVGPTLIQMGSEEQKQRYLQKILTGEEIWCQGYSEPNAGSDVANLQTSAEKKGDRWIINGQKVWTSAGHVADRCFLLARTDPTQKRHKGITVFLVDMHQEGVETRPIHQMNGESEFNEVFFNDAVAYDADIIGEVNEGWKVVMALLMHERAGMGGMVFSLERQFNETVKLAKTLKKNGKSLIKDPIVQSRMVDYYTRTRGALLNYYRNLTNTLKNGHPGPEGSMDKLVFSETTKELHGYAISLQGPFGTLWKTDSLVDTWWQDQYLHSFGVTIGGGTSEIQKNTIGERVLGLPKDMGR